MEFSIKSFNEIMTRFNKTALYFAVEKENIEIVQLLISNNKTDPDVIYILSYYYYKIHNKLFYCIQYQIIQWNSELNLSMKFNIKSFNEIQHQIIQ